MPSTFTANTGIEKIANGEQAGTWGTTTNLNFDILDRALNGSVTISLSGTTHTLTTSDGILSDGQFAVLAFAGSPSDTNTVTIAPNTAQKVYLVRNTSGQTVILSQGSGATVSVPTGGSKIVYANGAGAGAAVVDVTATLSGSLIGNASTATALQTARTIGGVSFNGTANISLPGVNATGDQNTTGSAATLTTARDFTVGATVRSFNGSANVAWSLADIGAPPTTRAVNSGTGLTGGGNLSADRTLALTGQALALHNLGTSGIIARTGAGTVAARTLSATGAASMTNGNGVSGNPTVTVTKLSKAQVEDSASTVFGAVSGQRLAQAIDVAVAALPEPVVDGVDLRNRVQAEVFAGPGAWATITGLAAVKAATFVLSATGAGFTVDDENSPIFEDRFILVALSTNNGATWTSTATISKFRSYESVAIGATAFVELDEGIVALTGGGFDVSSPHSQRAKYTAATYNAVRFSVVGGSGGGSIRVIPIIEQGREL